MVHPFDNLSRNVFIPSEKLPSGESLTVTFNQPWQIEDQSHVDQTGEKTLAQKKMVNSQPLTRENKVRLGPRRTWICLFF